MTSQPHTIDSLITALEALKTKEAGSTPVMTRETYLAGSLSTANDTLGIETIYMANPDGTDSSTVLCIVLS
jgi:hypothetical protein